MEAVKEMERDFETLVRQNYEKLTKYLIEKKLTISTMESATSGQIASLITDTEGASAVFFGGLITYSNETKIRAGVPREIVDTYSVYSKETAAAMADCCQQQFQTAIGIGVTGTMGNPDPQNPGSSVPGELYFAIAFEGKTGAFAVKLPSESNRLTYKLAAAEAVYEELDKLLSHMVEKKETGGI